MPQIEVKKIWDFVSVESSFGETSQVQIEKNENNLKGNSKEIKKSFRAQIPISYRQLQDYGYCIISQQKYTGEGHSKYEVFPISRQLTFLEKELQYKRKLSGLPAFLKIYITRAGGKEAQGTVVSERFGQRKVEWVGRLTLKI